MGASHILPLQILYIKKEMAMELSDPRTTIRNIKRYREIASVLVKYGFDEIVSRLNVFAVYRVGRKILRRKALTGISYAVRIRLALEELGPTFIKLGQVLSMRPFLIPTELVIELSKLQDQVAPLDPDIAIAEIEKNLGRKISESFSYLNPIPIASASLSQVHYAALLDGTPVVVKIQRPGIKRIIDSDMIILRDISSLMEKYMPETRQYEPVAIVDELARSTRKEINFLYEARNIEIFERNFHNDNRIFVPKVYWDYTTRRMITMDRIDGVKIDDLEKLKEKGIDPTEVCRIGGDIVFKMIFVDGFFHADPHPGNLFVTYDGRIAPVDYGMVGALSNSQMIQLADILSAVVSNNAALVVYTFDKAEVIPETSNLLAIEADVNEMITRYHKIPLARIDMATLSDEFFDIVHRHGIKVQSEFMVFGKALVTFEEVARKLDPDYDFIKSARPFVKRLAMKRFNWREFSKDANIVGLELRDFLVKLPGETRKFITKINKGKIKFDLEVSNLEKLLVELDRSSNRLSFAVIIAAIIIGSSWIMTINVGIKIFGLPALGLFGYLFAGILGARLAISILRSGKL